MSGGGEGRGPGDDLWRRESRSGLGLSEQVEHRRRVGKIVHLRVGHGEVKDGGVVGGVEIVGGLKFLDGLLRVALSEEDGSEGAVRGGDFWLKQHEFGEFLVGSGEVVAGVGGGAGAESSLCRAEIAFGAGGVCLGVRLAVSRWGSSREACAEQQRKGVQRSHISDYCNSRNRSRCAVDCSSG